MRMGGGSSAKLRVALRKESVDRNGTIRLLKLLCCLVALRKESVDRNVFYQPFFLYFSLSLSARRAWIEIKNLPI